MTRRSHRLRASAHKEKTARIPASVNVRAAAQPEEGKQAGPATFEASPAYSGGVLPGYAADLDLPVVVDLQGLTEGRAMKANLDHERKQRVGHVTKVENDKKTLAISGVLSAANQYRDEVAQSANNEYPWEVSIEASLRSLEKIPSGKSVKVNGQSFNGPIYVSRKSTLTGIAFADAGADRGNAVKIAASAASIKESNMDLDQWIESKGFDPSTISDSQRAFLKASFDAEKSGGPSKILGGADDGEEILTGRKAEDNRVKEIRLVANRIYNEDPHNGEEVELLAKDAIDNRWDPREFEVRLLRSRRAPSKSRSTGSNGKVDGQVLECAMLKAAGYPLLEKQYEEKTLDTVDREYRSIGLQQVILMAALHNGYPGRAGERIHPGNLDSVLQYAFPPAHAQLRASGFSTVSLANLISNVGNKELSAGFSETDQEWRQVSIIKNVNNYFAHTVGSLYGRTEFEDLTPAGEIKHGDLSDAAYTAQAKTSAKMYQISHEDIVNDDIGVFDRMRTIVGRGGGEKLNRDFWTQWLDHTTFWTTARGNKITGSTTTLLIDGVGLELAKLAFYALRTPTEDGARRVMGPPVMLVVPPELSTVAERFYNSLNLVGGSSSIPDTNIHQNKYRPLVVPQLSDANYTGYSSTHWWLLRSPSIAPPMVVAAIGGRVEPTIETAAANFNQLGIQMRGWQTAKPSKAEYLCGVMSKGAA